MAAAGSRSGRRARAAAPALLKALALAAPLALLLAALPPPGSLFAGGAGGAAPRGARRAPGAAAAAAAGGAAGAALAPEAALEDERLLGAWRYGGGAYRIAREEGGRVVFRESGLAGELRPSGEWLVAELPPAGTIRLKLTAGEAQLQSNFRPAEGGQWGEEIAAMKEWGSLAAKGGQLQRDLAGLEFEGAGGGVAVVVDGRQRPVALRLSPEAAADAPGLGRLVAAAHARAAEESLEAMTERLREVYASHFGGPASAPPADAR